MPHGTHRGLVRDGRETHQVTDAGARPVIRLETLLAGFDHARGRFLRSGSTGAEGAFIALFEALNWVVAIDDRLREPDALGHGWADRLRPGEAGVMKGVRFARNAVHHSWADALLFDESAIQPRREPRPDVLGHTVDELTLPFAYGWRWRLKLRLPRDLRLGQFYVDHLAGVSAATTLDTLQLIYHFHALPLCFVPLQPPEDP